MVGKNVGKCGDVCKQSFNGSRWQLGKCLVGWRKYRFVTRGAERIYQVGGLNCSNKRGKVTIFDECVYDGSFSLAFVIVEAVDDPLFFVEPPIIFLVKVGI